MAGFRNDFEREEIEKSLTRPCSSCRLMIQKKVILSFRFVRNGVLWLI